LCIELYGVIKKIKPDIVLAYTIKPVIYGSVIARLLGIKQVYVMITGVGSALLGESLKRRVFQVFIKGLYRISMPSCKKVFFQNADDAALFQKLKLVSPTQVVLINGSGVDLSYYQHKALPQAFCFLLIARIIREKGVFEFIEAARRLKLQYPEVSFKILGDFHSNPTALLREQFFGLVNDAGVEFLGEYEDVRPFIELSSVFVLPSYREGVPRSALEAMAMGRPIITTDAPGCRETVFDGENGYLVPIKNVDVLVEKMEHLINHSGLLMLMGQKSRQMAEDKFNVHYVNQKIINEMLNGGESLESI
jgi:glycosyltransferase involved in cell wall biosynthesis